jgi:hypothetical protein
MADFAFTDSSDKEFIIRLTSEERIAEARRIISGEEKDAVHVMGSIRKQRVDYNPGWSFHLDPDTITFFAAAIEVCDASIVSRFQPACIHLAAQSSDNVVVTGRALCGHAPL